MRSYKTEKLEGIEVEILFEELSDITLSLWVDGGGLWRGDEIKIHGDADIAIPVDRIDSLITALRFAKDEHERLTAEMKTDSRYERT